jgi:hypothetical protein
MVVWVGGAGASVHVGLYAPASKGPLQVADDHAHVKDPAELAHRTLWREHRVQYLDRDMVVQVIDV